MYNVKERYNLNVENLQMLVNEYNQYQQRIQELEAARNQVGNKIIAVQGIIEELKPFLEEQKIEQ